MKNFLCVVVLILALMSSSSSYSYAAKRSSYKRIDLDLTKFSSVMLYSGVFDIMSNPKAYDGKVIKIQGMFDSFHDDKTNEDLFAVVIMDEGACCATGIDFVLRDAKQHKYPEDYPETGEIITLVGRFELYREGEDLFCRLSNAEIL